MDLNYAPYDMLQDAVDEGLISENSTAYGIARLSIDQGYDSLSPKQKTVYDLHVAPHFKNLATRRETEDRKRGMPD